MNDIMNDISAGLQEFNLTRQEAIVYLCLLTSGERNGYEVAKQTGLSRSNAYTALASLVEKGAAWVLETSSTRYAAVPLREFCDNRLRHLQTLRDKLLAALPARRLETGGYITIRGRQPIIDKLKNLLAAASSRVYLALDSVLLGQLADELQMLLARGCKVVVITDGRAGPFLKGAIVYQGKPEKHQVRLITDSLFVLTGELEGGEGAVALFSDRKNLVDLFKSALKNEIRLIELEASGPGSINETGSGGKSG